MIELPPLAESKAPLSWTLLPKHVSQDPILQVLPSTLVFNCLTGHHRVPFPWLYRVSKCNCVQIQVCSGGRNSGYLSGEYLLLRVPILRVWSAGWQPQQPLGSCETYIMSPRTPPHLQNRSAGQQGPRWLIHKPVKVWEALPVSALPEKFEGNVDTWVLPPELLMSLARVQPGPQELLQSSPLPGSV